MSSDQTEQQTKEAQLPKPATSGQRKKQPELHKGSTPIRAWQYVGVVFFCFVASFFGSWVFLATGIVNPNSIDNIAKNRSNIVVQEGELVADIADKAAPSVVSVVAETPAESLFGPPNNSTQSAGTGVIISRDGYVLTNKHVIADDARNVQVVGSDGTVYEDVSVVGKDPLNDIGFLKINGANNLTPIQIGDSHQVEVGQKVVAIGNALGEYQNTVTSGIISGIGRPVRAADGSGRLEQLENLFQTDAAINPGNSGGPLLNLEGEVIGLNTAIAERAEGIGFAIPINATKGLVRTVTETGKVSRAYLGVQYRTITPALAKQQDLPVQQGAYLNAGQNQNAIVNDSPADKAGLEDGDIITKVGDKDVNVRSGLALLLAEHVPGDQVTLTVLRGGDEIQVQVTLGTYR